jgi:predicted phage-related endonuclease
MIPQDSPSWVPARVGNLGASQIGMAIKRTKSGWSDSRTTLAYQIVAERVTGIAASHFVTDAMQWGLDNEAAACELYEARSGNLTQKAGWFQHPTIEHFGATPDRLIDSDGLLEAKCPTTVKYIGWRRDGVVPEEHQPQMLAQLACTGRKYVDFVAFDPRIQDPKLQLFVRRFEPPREKIAEVEEQAREFLAYVETLFRAFTEAQ